MLKTRLLIILICCFFAASCGAGSALQDDNGSTYSGNPDELAEPGPPDEPAAPDAIPENAPSDDGGITSNPFVGSLPLSIAAKSSSTLTVNWEIPADTSKSTIYISSEPATTGTTSLPGEVKIAEVAGDVNFYLLADLAPLVNVFVRVESQTPDGFYSAYTRSKTEGGPRAVLETPVREVHVVAPNILQIVLADGVGSGWQDGAWSLARSDGSVINITNVYRQSIPVSADDYVQRLDDPHFYEIVSDEVTATDHRIYLVLDQAIGEREILHVTGPSSVDFILPFSDRYLETPSVQLNQVGYNPRATKRWAYVSMWLGDGGAMSLDSFPTTAQVLTEPEDEMIGRAVVLDNLSITPRIVSGAANNFDSEAGTYVDEIDLSMLPAAEGVRYRIRIPGVGVSWRTAVSEEQAYRAFYVVTRGLFFNRWAGDLREDLTGWSRPPDHTTVYTSDLISDFDTKFNETDPLNGARSLIGGYHDAGDYDQRPMHTVVPQLLLRAYELNPSLYLDGQLNIPESGNGIPDLLDEAMWGVAAWEQLQEADGGVRQGVESFRHPPYSHANYDVDPYWTYMRDAKVSARVAGVFAQAARLIEPYSPAKSASLTAKAISAYAYAKANSGPAAFMLYGASELYRLTNDPFYQDEFKAIWNSIGPYGAFNRLSLNHLGMSDYGAGGDQPMPDYFLGYLGVEGMSSVIEGTNALSWINSYANIRTTDTIDSEHAHRNPRPGGYPWTWGQGTAVSKYLDPVVARLQLGGVSEADRQRYFDAFSLVADYVLGGNQNGFVYITGLGSRHPVEPLHTDSLVFIREGKGAMPGIPVYGPANDQGGAYYVLPTLNAFYPTYANHPTALRYADTRPFVKSNEFTCWEVQAPLTELFAILLGEGMTPAALSDTSCGIDHCDR